MHNLFDIAGRFKLQGRVMDIRPFGNGNINETSLVTTDSTANNHFILQRINTRVFSQPELVMQNMRVFTEHAQRRLWCTSLGSRRWEIPRVLLTGDGATHWSGSDGSFWRALTFIEAAESFDTVRDTKHAQEAGYAIGFFHNLTSDLPAESLADTLEGFHITPRYLQHHDGVMAQHRVSKSPEVKYCLKFIDERKDWARILEDAKAHGNLPLRTMHGDPKINNVLIDTATGLAVGIIDLDTAKPGLVHYDIGDCLRSGCNPLGEETGNWEAVYFDADICKAILKGYLSQARAFLTMNDYEYLFDAIRLMAFELGLRFFTDYLEGNVYFRAKHREHNLVRALVQFRLTESIESKESDIRKIIQGIK